MRRTAPQIRPLLLTHLGPRRTSLHRPDGRRPTSALVLTSYSGSHTVLLARLDKSDRPLDRCGVGAYRRLPVRGCSRVGSRSCL